MNQSPQKLHTEEGANIKVPSKFPLHEHLHSLCYYCAPILNKEEQLLLRCPVSSDNFWESVNLYNFFLEEKGLGLMAVLSQSLIVSCHFFHGEEESVSSPHEPGQAHACLEQVSTAKGP